MSTEDLVTIMSFWDAHEAQLAKIRLEAEGIRVFLSGENAGIGLGLYANAMGGIKLLVAEPDADRASELLDDAPTAVTEQASSGEMTGAELTDTSAIESTQSESFEDYDSDGDDGPERSSLDGLRSLKHLIIWGFLAVPILGLIGSAAIIFKMLTEFTGSLVGAK